MTTSTEPKFAFDLSQHVYTLDGERLPSVTEILEDLGFIDKEYYTEEGRRRGADVHFFCQYLDEGDYDRRAAEARGVAGYVESYRKAKEMIGNTFCKQIEPRLFHPLFKFAGSPDRLMDVRGQEQLWDLKTGAPEPWHGYQTAAYDLLAGGKSQRLRFGVHLQEDGSTAKFVAHRDLNDGNFFLAFLTTHQRRRVHGIARNGR